MKLQSLVFIPVWGLLCLHSLSKDKWLKQMFLSLLCAIVTQCMLLLPFILSGRVDDVVNVVFSSVDYYPTVSMNAFNFWHLVVKADPIHVSDKGQFFFGLTYKQTGLILFCMLSVLALWPLLYGVWIKITKGKEVVTREAIWLSCSLVSIIFFYFNTQMHERYCHPAFLFLTAYTFYTGRFLIYGLFSIAYFLQLEAVLRFLQLHNYGIAVFNPKLIAVLFFIILVLLFVRLYKDLRLQVRMSNEASTGLAIG